MVAYSNVAVSLSLCVLGKKTKNINNLLKSTSPPTWTKGFSIHEHTHTCRRVHHTLTAWPISGDMWRFDGANEAQQLMSEPYKLYKWGPPWCVRHPKPLMEPAEAHANRTTSSRSLFILRQRLRGRRVGAARKMRLTEHWLEIEFFRRANKQHRFGDQYDWCVIICVYIHIMYTYIYDTHMHIYVYTHIYYNTYMYLYYKYMLLYTCV